MEAGRRLPLTLVMIEHEQDDEGELAHALVAADVALPDAHHVEQHAKRHQRVVAALVLEQHINENLTVHSWGERKEQAPRSCRR